MFQNLLFFCCWFCTKTLVIWLSETFQNKVMAVNGARMTSLFILFCFCHFFCLLISLSCLSSVFWILSSLPFKTHHWSSGSYWLIQMSKHTCNKHVAGLIHACVTPIWLLFSLPLFFCYYTLKKKIIYHTYRSACTHSFMHIYIHMCTWTNVYMHAHANTHTHMHAHACAHTHMHTYMQRVIPY